MKNTAVNPVSFSDATQSTEYNRWDVDQALERAQIDATLEAIDAIFNAGQEAPPAQKMELALTAMRLANDTAVKEKAIRTLTREASIDPMTGLYNRHFCENTIEKMMERLHHDHANGEQNDKNSMTVLYFDLNALKAVNDALGHEAGDNLLKAFGAFLKENMRPQDIVARGGGGADEFVVVLQGKVKDAATFKISEAMDFAFMNYDGVRVPIRASLGAVELHVGNINQFPDVASVMKVADNLMGEHKATEKARLGIERISNLGDIITAYERDTKAVQTSLTDDQPKPISA